MQNYINVETLPAKIIAENPSLQKNVQEKAVDAILAENNIVCNVQYLGEFSSHIEAEHAFFRQFPLGILAEGDHHGVQQMPTRGHAREYAKNFPEWQAKDAGVLCQPARWHVVKRNNTGE